MGSERAPETDDGCLLPEKYIQSGPAELLYPRKPANIKRVFGHPPTACAMSWISRDELGSDWYISAFPPADSVTTASTVLLIYQPLTATPSTFYVRPVG